MKKLLIACLLIIFSCSFNVQAEALSPEQNAIKSLIQKMYAIDPDIFEYATFGAKYKNGEEIVSGKIDHNRHCQLLAEFLVPDAVIPVKNKYAAKLGCMTGADGFFRYPGVGDLSPHNNEAPPKHHISTPVVKGDKARVYVNLDNAGNDMYYLKKLPEGWRIHKIVSRENGSTSEIIDDYDMIKIFPPETGDAMKTARQLNAEWTSLPGGK